MKIIRIICSALFLVGLWGSISSSEAAYNPNSWAVYPSVTPALAFPIWPDFTPQMFDAACGQSAHDCTTGLTDCENSANGAGALYAVCLIPPGTYTIFSPIKFCAPTIGTSSNGSVISTSGSFVGTYMLDFNCSGAGVQQDLENLEFTMAPLGTA
jgi:hypothetical protein